MTDKTINITPICAFQDNYIWCITQENRCAVVDPGDAIPVLEHLKNHNLTLTDILITHHHPDHIGGVRALVDEFPDLNIIGIDSPRIPQVTTQVDDGDVITLKGVSATFKIFMLPGHTKDHIAFYGELGLFCGDTLFSAGCGRLFEGTPTQMQQSLDRLTDLPGTTKVYCTHEYTLANVEFALHAEPNNDALKAYQLWATAQRNSGIPTLPSTIDEQKGINPFLRTFSPDIQQTLQQKLNRQVSDKLEVFTELRRWKDHF